MARRASPAEIERIGDAMAAATGIRPDRALVRTYRIDGMTLSTISAPEPTDETRCWDIIVIPEGRFVANVMPRTGAYAIDPSKPLPHPIPPVTYDQAQAEKAADPDRVVIPPLPREALTQGATHPDAAASRPSSVARGEPKVENPEDIERLFHAIRHRWGYK